MSRDSAQGLAQLYGANLSWRKWATFVGVALLGATSLAAQVAGRQNRISQAASAKPNTELSGTVHPLIAKATDLGSVNSNLQLNSMTLHIALSAAQKQEIAALQKALQDRNSPQYHKFLTQAEYGARFGLTDADLSQLKSWLTSQGFTANSVSKTRTSISFSGKASQVESAFQTHLHQYRLNGETHFANATALHVPAQFAGVVLNVSGLDTFRPKPRANRISARPYYTLDSSDYYLTPADWATIYSLNSVYTAGFDGTGVHVGVVGQTYAPQADIDNFRTAAGLSATKLTYACISSADCTDAVGISQGDLGEADVDIEWAGGIAKNATVDFIYAAADDPNQGAFEALTYAVNSYATADGSVVPVISMSYGSCETQLAGSTVQLFDQLGAQANVQGQTLVVASGDSGPAGCDPSNDPGTPAATQGLSVQAPADSGNFTAVGGTTFSGDQNNPATYWNQTLGQVNTALQYIPEIAWNESNQVSSGLDASGGGESTLIPQPSWQSGLIASSTGRLVPDVAFSAAANHDLWYNVRQWHFRQQWRHRRHGAYDRRRHFGTHTRLRWNAGTVCPALRPSGKHQPNAIWAISRLFKFN
jgi:subtilase family serine protease